MRLELIHPMLIHFPIALLITGLALRIAASWTAKKHIFAFLLPASWTVLSLGVIAAWSAVIAGEIAQEIVQLTLGNIEILNNHSEHAYITAFGFTIALLFDGTRAFLLRMRKKRWVVERGLIVLVWTIYLFSLGNLIVTGYYGGTLVYEEGAAVSGKNH